MVVPQLRCFKNISYNISFKINGLTIKSKPSLIGMLQAFADTKSSYETSSKTPIVKKKTEITVEELGLEPPCNEVVRLQSFSASFIQTSLFYIFD